MVIVLRLYGRKRIILISKKKISHILVLTVTIIAFIIILNFTTDIFVRNLNEYIDNYLDNYAQEALNDAIIAVTAQYDFDTSTFVRVNTSASGQTSYLETDTIAVNEFKSKVGNKIIENLSKNDKKTIGFKILNMLGNTYLINKGPSLKITVFPVGSATTNLVSKFSSSGVNQTMHELLMTVNIKTRVVFPFGSVKKTGSAAVPVTNTVIVGEVPDSYVNVTSDDENLKNDILQLATE